MQIRISLLSGIAPSLFLVTLATPKFVLKPIKLQLPAGILAARLLPSLEIALKRKIHLNMDFYPVQFFCTGIQGSNSFLFLPAFVCPAVPSSSYFICFVQSL